MFVMLSMLEGFSNFPPILAKRSNEKFQLDGFSFVVVNFEKSFLKMLYIILSCEIVGKKGFIFHKIIMLE